MGREFWRTVQLAMRLDNWTARLVVVLCGTGVPALTVYMISVTR